MQPTSDNLPRCAWAGSDPLMIAYHDSEWGVPLHDEVRLFEFLVLEGAQAGLSWNTVLQKRANYRRAFDDFDPALVAQYGEADVARLLADPGIIRNRAKIAAAITNAKHYRAIQQQHGSFDSYLWAFVGGQPIINHYATLADLPPFTPQAEVLSKDLKRRGFSFVGPTICYSLMQAVGMVNDHTTNCFLRTEKLSVDGSRPYGLGAKG